MVLNKNKSKIMSIKDETATAEESQSSQIVKNQKELRVIISSIFSWAEICRSKGWSSFSAVKKHLNRRKSLNFISTLSQLYLNLISHISISCVVPVLSYASQVWYTSEIEPNALERVQIVATEWICSSMDDYKTRLTELDILRISIFE